ncbi:MAG: acetylglutamate kinase [SAR202 cluster bacterium Io17-Chloro-G2]|nr:MAG: acetylglutamate kinase [SAR202 cluster bacterium Io17-Chloro-G2]
MPGLPVVVKIGGSTLGSHDTSLRDLVTLQQEGTAAVVVHGGGNVISEWMQRQGIPPRFVRGLRVTDAASLEIVVAVLTGLINKELVSGLHALGGKAIGISGIDGGLLEARIADPELGFVGEIQQVNGGALQVILDSGYIPIVAPLAMHCHDGSDHAGRALNMNGDTVAGELAHALGAERLIFLTDVEGIMDGNGRVIPRLDRRTASLLSTSGVIRGGMIPKLDACMRALEVQHSPQGPAGQAPVAYVVDGRRPEALLDCVRGIATGTSIIGDFAR